MNDLMSLIQNENLRQKLLLLILFDFFPTTDALFNTHMKSCTWVFKLGIAFPKGLS